MKIETFKKLCANYSKEPNEDLYLCWNEMLDGYDPYYVDMAVNSIVKNDKFFPTFNRILEVIKELPPMEIPEEEKIKRMKAKGVIPKWFNSKLTSTPYEDEDFKAFINDFRAGA